jgi:DNA-binding LacI/PurR family transcriptional regulator
MRSRQVTIKDIAKQLGISASTVSRALQDHKDISDQTKLRIKALAKEMNYQPNAIALSLQRSKSNVIGIIVPQIVHHFFSTVISGIEEYAGKKGYHVIICQSNESPEREVVNTQTLISSRVAGIIVSGTKYTEHFEHFQTVLDSNIPIVFFDRTIHDLRTDRVVIDDYKAAFEATEHLIKTGCKNIIHFSGPENLKISAKRMWGYRDALKKYAIPFKEENIIKADNIYEGEKETENLINNRQVPDGIFAVNDETAAGALTALKKHNIKIPDQVSVMGFTNGLVSTITIPTLSTVEQNGFLMGYKSAELLIKRIENNDLPEVNEIIPTKLILRDSTRKMKIS